MKTISFLVCMVGILSGCQTIEVKQKQFLLPDKPITQSLLDTIGRQQILQKLQLETKDGVVLGGFLIKTPQAKFTLLYFGGNIFRTHIMGADIVEQLALFDNNLVIMDHRGYGLSQGEPNIDNLEKDSVEIYDFVRTQTDTKNLPIIVHGLSLGSMIAGFLSNQRALDGLVLEATVTNAKDWADSVIPWYASPFVTINLSEPLKQINNSQRLNKYTGPLLLMVGENDDQTPPSLSKKLFKQAKSLNKTLLVLSGKRHGNATEHKDFKAHYQRFIDKALTHTASDSIENN